MTERGVVQTLRALADEGIIPCIQLRKPRRSRAVGTP